MKYTLITGSSKGIGVEMAYVCAQRKMNLLLVSLPNENLSDITRDISHKYGVETDYFETDLSKDKNIQNVLKWVKEREYDVNFLINNVGIGGIGPFESYSEEYINNTININIKATTKLCYFFLPELKKNAPSFLLNNSSMMANFSCPYKSVYSASKIYIKNFSRALREEFKPFNISVSTLQPGATPTTELVRNQVESGGRLARISLTEPKLVAEVAISKTLAKKKYIIPGWHNKVIVFILSLLPPSVKIQLVLHSTKSMLKNGVKS